MLLDYLHDIEKSKVKVLRDALYGMVFSCGVGLAVAMVLLVLVFTMAVNG